MSEYETYQMIPEAVLVFMWMHAVLNVLGMTERRIFRRLTPFSDIGVLLVHMLTLPPLTCLYFLMSGFFD